MRTIQVKHYDGFADYVKESDYTSFEEFLIKEFFPYMAKHKDTWVTNMTHSAKTKDGKGFNCFQLMIGMIFRYFIEKQKEDETFVIREENLYQEINDILKSRFLAE